MRYLADVAEKPAGELSYGQQKLLAFARLAALRPAVLLLDEPTAALSPAMASKMVGLIKRLVSEQGLTVALIEHNMGVVRELADYIYFLHEGSVYMQGTQKEVLEKFDDCYAELTDINEREIFVYAFRLGARIAIEILSPSFNA